MQFPVSLLNVDTYYSKVYSVLQDDEVVVFIDTNIMARYYVFHSAARNELTNWFQQYKIKGKLKVPTWVLNEYTKHFIRDRTREYIEPANLINGISKDFIKFSDFLRMYLEPEQLNEYGYSDEQSFHDDLERIKNDLDKFKKAKKISQEYFINVHEELTTLFSDCVLSSDIFFAAEVVPEDGKGRYMHELPPGFEDKAKSLNTYGDLIVWKEVVDYCKNEDVKKAVIITNDSKRDWLYAPYKVVVKGRTVPNSGQEYKIADTRLVYEFKLVTGSDELYIISVDNLVKAMLNNGKTNLLEVAKALQVQHIHEEESAKGSEETDAVENDDINPSSTETTESHSDENGEKNAINQESSEPHAESSSPSDNIQFSDIALADSKYLEFKAHEIGKIVEKLKSYNWYEQNPAIERISHLDYINLAKSNDVHNDVFVLGRNVYQAACGGAWSASYLINTLRMSNNVFPEHIAQQLISGMAYELYFNSQGELRKGNFKTGYIGVIFSLLGDERNERACEFILNALKPYNDFLLILPNQKAPIKLELSYEQIEDHPLGGNHNYVTSLKFGDEELVVDSTMDQFHSTYLTIDELKDLLETVFAIPKHLVEIEYVEEPDKYLSIRRSDILWRGDVPKVEEDTNW